MITTIVLTFLLCVVEICSPHQPNSPHPPIGCSPRKRCLLPSPLPPPLSLLILSPLRVECFTQMTVMAKLFGKDVSAYDDINIDELLTQLTEAEIEELGQELIDPDVSAGLLSS